MLLSRTAEEKVVVSIVTCVEDIFNVQKATITAPTRTATGTYAPFVLRKKRLSD
jgi:hypothetical protein